MENADYNPQLIFCEVTPGRNLRCLPCRATAVELPSSIDLPINRSPDLSDASLSAIPANLVFSGGEPLLRLGVFYLDL
jgi:MoaA/NifB/PqqE/SkfB family radical SAM enzyme